MGPDQKSTPTNGSRHRQNGEPTANSYHRTNQLKKLVDNVSLTTNEYAYNTAGMRIAQKVTPNAGSSVTASTTIYLEGQELTWTGSATIPTVDRYYQIPGGPTLALRKQNNTIHWLFNDHQQTSTHALQQNQTIPTAQRYLPFGQTRGSSNVLPTQHGFLGKTEDDHTRTVHTDNREYDTSIMQFTSVDPIVTSTAAPYNYAAGNPSTLSDPSGLWGGTCAQLIASYGVDCDVSKPTSDPTGPIVVHGPEPAVTDSPEVEDSSVADLLTGFQLAGESGSDLAEQLWASTEDGATLEVKVFSVGQAQYFIVNDGKTTAVFTSQFEGVVVTARAVPTSTRGLGERISEALSKVEKVATAAQIAKAFVEGWKESEGESIAARFASGLSSAAPVVFTIGVDGVIAVAGGAPCGPAAIACGTAAVFIVHATAGAVTGSKAPPSYTRTGVTDCESMNNMGFKETVPEYEACL